MGDPKKTRKKYLRPRKPWDKIRLEEERTLKETYGLKNKKELWVTEKILKNKRQNSRKLLALELEKRIQREKELLESLKTIGILKGNATLDDVLGLKIEEFLERRLQTIVWRKGLANTPKQARQFIVHGHIAVNEKKVKTPSYMTKAEEEGTIGYYKKPLKLKQGKTKKEETKEKAEEQKKETKPEKNKEDKKENTEKKETQKTEKITKKEDTLKKETTEKKTEKKETKKDETPKKEEKTKEKKKDKKEEAKK